ncbi:MAG TPA: hypothetical protein VI113_03810, partial [Alphaproteobacteria bacterium]
AIIAKPEFRRNVSKPTRGRFVCGGLSALANRNLCALCAARNEHGLSKAFHGRPAIEDIDFTASRHEFVAVG